MDNRKNFQAVTNLQPLKKNATQVCGQEFIDTLTARHIYAKDDIFWLEVNCYLNIPNNAYEQMLIAKQEELKIHEANLATERQSEIVRLLENKRLLYEKTRQSWTIKLFESPESKMFGKYFAEATSLDNTPLTSSFFDTVHKAEQNIFSLIDQFDNKNEKEVLFTKYYRVLKPIYLMFLYLSGSDEYFEKERCKETFTGVRSWISLQWDILDRLEKEGLLEQPQRKSPNPKKVTYVELTKNGIKEARKNLQNINLDGVDALLLERTYHEEYIKHKTNLDLNREIDNDQ
ncbi:MULTISPECIES: DUF6429 family protein [Pseudanabaena]|uniref:DUF6429 domain-containing protein n=2 Tax=Pseudanabaena TaxID=1152 RepID=L8N322_9CYAN|nr:MULTISPECIES: DUF6429 family protein [Pseudanabaena]ELS34637.1 hypothetical protein Pse7429DRAFT_0179 [Pseudanabaena biceps PCC 7429]MDG3493160.1 DUF6429 family protein [Pseudanabaena catenata USMAC16]